MNPSCMPWPSLSPTELWAWARRQEEAILSPLSLEPMVDALTLTCGHQLAARDVAAMRRAGRDHCPTCTVPLAEDGALVPSDSTRAAARLYVQLFRDGLDLGRASVPELTRWAQLAAGPRAVAGAGAWPIRLPPPPQRPTLHAAAPPQRLPPPSLRPIRLGRDGEAEHFEPSADLAALFPGLTLPAPAPARPQEGTSGGAVPSAPVRAPEPEPEPEPAPAAACLPGPVSAGRILYLVDALDRAHAMRGPMTSTSRMLATARSHLIATGGPLVGEAELDQLDQAARAAEAMAESCWVDAWQRVLTWDRGPWTPTNRALRRAVLGALRALARASQPPKGKYRDSFDRLVRLLDALFLGPSTRDGAPIVRPRPRPAP